MYHSDHIYNTTDLLAAISTMIHGGSVIWHCYSDTMGDWILNIYIWKDAMTLYIKLDKQIDISMVYQLNG